MKDGTSNLREFVSKSCSTSYTNCPQELLYDKGFEENDNGQRSTSTLAPPSQPHPSHLKIKIILPTPVIYTVDYEYNSLQSSYQIKVLTRKQLNIS